MAQKLDSSENQQTNLKTVELELVSSKKETDILDQVFNKKTKREHIKDFGFVMACFFAIIASAQMYLHTERGNIALGLVFVSCCFYLGSIHLPRLMLPVFSGWMFIGKYIEVVMTFFILGVMWAITFLPIGLLFKLIGKSALTLKLDRAAASYWENCDVSRADFKLLERQY